MTEIRIRLNDDGTIYLMDFDKALERVAEWGRRTGSVLKIGLEQEPDHDRVPPNPFDNWPKGEPGSGAGGSGFAHPTDGLYSGPSETPVPDAVVEERK